MTAISAQKNKKIKRERKWHYYICVWNTEEANVTGNIKTDPIITGRSWESCSINRTMVIDFPPLSLKVTEEITRLTFLKYFHLQNIETMRLPNQGVWVYSLIHWKICWKACHYSFRNCPSFSYRTPWNMQHHICWLFTKNLAESVSVHFSTQPQPQQRRGIMHAELSLIQPY